MYRSYMICTSAGSGSTHLCTMLASLKEVGRPASYFYAPVLQDWMDRFGVTDTTMDEPALIRRLVLAAQIRGRGGSPIFGLRQQGSSFPFLCAKLARAFPEAESDLARITAAFGPTLFIHLTRQDKLAQAVSLCKAQQSGLWHLAQDGSELERDAPPRLPVYNHAMITGALTELHRLDADWLGWFAKEGVEPLRITYQALSDDASQAVARVLGALSCAPELAQSVQPQTRKMADALSADWIRRYQAGDGAA